MAQSDNWPWIGGKCGCGECKDKKSVTAAELEDKALKKRINEASKTYGY